MRRRSLLSIEGVEKTRALMEFCLGKGKADLAVIHGTLLDVYTGEWIDNPGVLVKGEWIIHVGSDLRDAIGPETCLLDAAGRVIVPGLIEGHTHLADALYSPAVFLRRAMVGGTTTIITEIIEPFPIGGEKGLNDYLDAFKNQPIKVFATVPGMASLSPFCHGVPGDALQRLLAREEVIGLGEPYWQAVLKDTGTFLPNFLETHLSGGKVEGHSAGARGRNLSAYALTGISSCHEPTTPEETLERLRLGLHVMIREGSIRKDLDAMVDLMNSGIDSRRLILITDGVRPEDLFEKGYLEHVVQRAMDRGVDPRRAIQMATVNVADYFGLDGIVGGIAAGKQADLLVLPGKSDLRPEWVISKGKVISRDGELLVAPREHNFTPETLHSVKLPKPARPEDFVLRVDTGKNRVTVRVIHQITDLVTKETTVSVPVVDGEIRTDPGIDLLKVAAIERRFAPGKTFVGLIRGFGLRKGALACSAAWDTSDIIVVGENESDMAQAVNRIDALQGGLVLCAGGSVLVEIPLPIFGLMSDMALPELVKRLKELKRHAMALGFPFEDPHRTLIPLTCAGIPFLRISEQGLVDIKSGRALPLIVDGGENP